jgi:hypothetical protein
VFAFIPVHLLDVPDNAERLPLVDLIRGPSRGDVLSDVWAGAADATGDLFLPLAEAGSGDRVDAGAFPLAQHSTIRLEIEEITTAAELLTAGRGWRPRGRPDRL